MQCTSLRLARQGLRAWCCVAGMKGAKLKGDDSVDDVVQCNDHDTLLFFTSDGVVRSLKAHQIPQGSRTATGSAITQVHPPLLQTPTSSQPTYCVRALIASLTSFLPSALPYVCPPLCLRTPVKPPSCPR